MTDLETILFFHKKGKDKQVKMLLNAIVAYEKSQKNYFGKASPTEVAKLSNCSCVK